MLHGSLKTFFRFQKTGFCEDRLLPLRLLKVSFLLKEFKVSRTRLVDPTAFIMRAV